MMREMDGIIYSVKQLPEMPLMRKRKTNLKTHLVSVRNLVF